MPDRIQWTDAAGTHDERLPLEPTVGEILNDQFHRMVRGDQSLAPTTCDLNVEDGNQFELAVAPQVVSIVKVGYEPTAAAELIAATSSLCKR